MNGEMGVLLRSVNVILFEKEETGGVLELRRVCDVRVDCRGGGGGRGPFVHAMCGAWLAHWCCSSKEEREREREEKAAACIVDCVR